MFSKMTSSASADITNEKKKYGPRSSSPWRPCDGQWSPSSCQRGSSIEYTVSGMCSADTESQYPTFSRILIDLLSLTVLADWARPMILPNRSHSLVLPPHGNPLAIAAGSRGAEGAAAPPEKSEFKKCGTKMYSNPSLKLLLVAMPLTLPLQPLWC